MNILITGAFGFVGTNLSKSIKTAFKHRLIAVDIHEPNKHGYDACFSWDELDKINAQDVDAIIHLAGKAHDTKNTTEEQTYFDINIGLTKKIFEFFLQSNASKFVFFSSVKAVADTVPGEYLTEETTPLPCGIKSKILMRSIIPRGEHCTRNFELQCPGTPYGRRNSFQNTPGTIITGK